MKRKKTQDIIDELLNFQKTLEKKPSLPEMFEQIKMMKFKFRPIQGSLINLDFNNKKLVEILWSLGKLDEFFMRKINKLKNEQEKERFFEFFSQIFNDYQQKLNKLPLSTTKKTSDQIKNILEIEIYKDLSIKN
ncbi:MAG: hypothetical protein Fur009_0710 [Candidatus Microgenomates bacterium]